MSKYEITIKDSYDDNNSKIFEHKLKILCLEYNADYKEIEEKEW